MATNDEIEVGAELLEALDLVPATFGDAVDEAVLLAWYIAAVAKDFGLSEHLELDGDRLARVELPKYVEDLVDRVIGHAHGSRDDDVIRAWIYALVVEVARDSRAGAVLNKSRPLAEADVLLLAQVYWNIERSEVRPRLPISGSDTADIKVPGKSQDFARMAWSSRMAEGLRGLGTGGSLRAKGARLAVLLALRAFLSPSAVERGRVEHLELHRPASGRAVIRRKQSHIEVAAPEIHRAGSMHERASVDNASPEQHLTPSVARPVGDGRVIVGGSRTGLAHYQLRAFDETVDSTWTAHHDRRVWIWGEPGTGKSFTARRVWQQALGSPADEVRVMIWVDAASPRTISSAMSDVVDRMPELGLGVEASDPDRVLKQAQRLLGALDTSTWGWLVVLDDAESRELIESELLPTGTNPRGRLLVTTAIYDHRIVRFGGIVEARNFTALEAKAYVERAALSTMDARPEVVARLIDAVDRHPLMLSIATATAAANAMTIDEWLVDFREAAGLITHAAPDEWGGYAETADAVWELALLRASRRDGIPLEVLRRAALVPAVSDPAGHPIWIWESPLLQAWLDPSGAFEAGRIRSIVLRTLADHGVLRIEGGWKDGVVTMHQISARAIRARAGNAEAHQILDLLLLLWLQRIADEGLGVPVRCGANVAALVEHDLRAPSPSSPLQRALQGFARDSVRHGSDARKAFEIGTQASAARWSSLFDELAGLAPYVSSPDQITIARYAWFAATDWRMARRPDQARGLEDRALEILGPIVEDDAVSGDDLAAALDLRAGLFEIRGDAGSAEADQRAAIGHRTHQLDEAMELGEWITIVEDLVDLVSEVEGTERARQVAERYGPRIERSVIDVPSDDPQAHKLLRGAASLLRRMERDDMARIGLVRSALALRRNAALTRFVHRQERSLAEMELSSGRWESAESLLRLSIVDEPPRAQVVSAYAVVLDGVGGRSDGSPIIDDAMRVARADLAEQSGGASPSARDLGGGFPEFNVDPWGYADRFMRVASVVARGRGGGRRAHGPAGRGRCVRVRCRGCARPGGRGGGSCHVAAG